MRYFVSIDVPDLDAGVRFYGAALQFVETSRPAPSYAVLKAGEAQIGLIEKAPGSHPAQGSADVRRYERHWTPVHVDFHVAEFDAVLARVLAAGGKCEQKFERSKHPAVAFCSDPFGNGFCIVEDVKA